MWLKHFSAIVLIWKKKVHFFIIRSYFVYSLKISGNYFPILRIEDWRSQKELKFIEDKVVEVFIYIFGVIFTLMAIVCFYQIYISTKSMTRWHPNLGFVLFLFLFLFNIGNFSALLIILILVLNLFLQWEVYIYLFCQVEN